MVQALAVRGQGSGFMVSGSSLGLKFCVGSLAALPATSSGSLCCLQCFAGVQMSGRAQCLKAR